MGSRCYMVNIVNVMKPIKTFQMDSIEQIYLRYFAGMRSQDFTDYSLTMHFPDFVGAARSIGQFP